MSHTHDIDNEEHLFHFDSCEESDMLHFTTIVPARQRPSALESNPHMPSHDGPSTSGEAYGTGAPEVVGKGKGVTRPMSIRVPIPALDDFFDSTHSSASTAPSTSRDSHRFLLTSLTPSSFDHSSLCDETQQQGEPSLEAFGETLRKGKEKEHPPPVLPPLTLSPTEFHYAPASSSPLQSSSPGPSSYASSCSPPSARITPHRDFHARILGEDQSSVPNSQNRNTPPLLKRMPSRRRSLPSLSACSSERSLAARSMLQIKLKLTSSRTSNDLARKLLFRTPTKPVSFGPELIKSQSIVGELVDNSPPSPPDPWRTGLKVDELDATISRFSNLRLHDINSRPPDSFYYNTTPLKHKGRSHSSPFPLSALDIVPVYSTDIFTPFPLVVKNYFEVLPYELRLHVLEALVGLHEADHRRSIDEGHWSAAKASSSKNKWVGRDKGVRELVKLSRVSKSWRTLVFDGPLWTNFDLCSFPNVPESLVLRLTTIGGKCSRALDISGHAQISGATLLQMTDHFCVNSSPDIDSLCYTQLTSINLQGCSSLSTRSLHYLLVRSRALQKLCVKGLAAVTNTTCDILSAYCPELVSLDISRCANVVAQGIKSMAKAATDRGQYIELRELRMCGLKNIDDDMMAALGKAMPHLEVLDLSYTRLHNSAVEAFVACEAEENVGFQTIFVSPRDFGRDSSDKFRRRVTSLRHLSLSCCLLLTDEACSNLSHSVPRLEFLELAGIGADMGDDGLVRLLNKTPYIRRLDLEDAAHITDAVLIAITPSTTATTSSPTTGNTLPEPGHALEQLNISFATNVTDETLLSLIRRCTRLRHLEADNTRIGSAVLREFVRQCRKRQMTNAKAVVVDCRGVSENTVKDLAVLTRPRMGWRAYEARKLAFLDARDANADEMKVGQDECDEQRVVVKSFYSWQTVDAVKAVREKRRKARRMSSLGGDEWDDASGRTFRWWAPGRISPRSGRSSPLNITDMNSDGCNIM